MSYHGTSSSMVQFLHNRDDGEQFPPAQFPDQVNRESKKLAPLPSDYTSVKNVHPKKFSTELYAPPSPDHVSPTEFPNYDSAVAWKVRRTSFKSFIPGWLHIMHHRNAGF